MSTEIRRLLKRWREEARVLLRDQPIGFGHRAPTLDRCADELEALLASPPGQKAPQVNGATLIAAERARHQVRWDTAHDAGHRDGSLAVVAATLATEGTDARVEDRAGWRGSSDDPWGLPSKHRGDRVRQLVTAGALIAAEIDRERTHCLNPDYCGTGDVETLCDHCKASGLPPVNAQNKKP